MKGRLFTLLLVFVWSTSAQLPVSPSSVDGDDGLASRTNALNIVRFEQSPVIDGELNEEVWRSAATLRNFFERSAGVNVPATVGTVVLLGRSDELLYVGVRSDALSEKSRIRSGPAADPAVRDDVVEIILDSYHDRERALVVTLDANGLISNGLFRDGSDVVHDSTIDIQARGSRTNTGYTVEAAIPLKYLRTGPAGPGWLGINVVRRIRSGDRLLSWMPIAADGEWHLGTAGKLTGFEDLRRKPRYELTAIFTAAQDQLRVRDTSGRTDAPGLAADGTHLQRQRTVIKPGIAAKVNISPNVELSLAVNPGYLAGTGIFRPSNYFQRKRSSLDPDFAIRRNRSIAGFAVKDTYLDGLAAFDTPLEVVSRYAIVDPDYLVRLAGSRGKLVYDALAVRDPAPGRFTPQELEHPQVRRNFARYMDRNAYLNAVRAEYKVRGRSTIGALSTLYSFADIHSVSAGVDGRVELSERDVLTFQIVGVNSHRPFFDKYTGRDISSSKNGIGYFAGFQRKRRNIDMAFSAEGRSNHYRADLGFTRRFDLNRKTSLIRYRADPRPGSTLSGWGVGNRSEIAYDWQGRLRHWTTESKIDMSFPRETYLTIGYGSGYERLLEEDYGISRLSGEPGAFVGDAEREARSTTVSLYGESSPSRLVSLSSYFSYKWGEFDLDYDAGPRYLRASPAGLLDPDSPLDPAAGRLLYLEASVLFRPLDSLQLSADFYKNTLTRDDNGRIAFDGNTFGGRMTWRFPNGLFVRSRFDYSTLALRMRGQLVTGFEASSGRALYLVYNTDRARAGYGPFFISLAPEFRTNGQNVLVRFVQPLFGADGAGK